MKSGSLYYYNNNYYDVTNKTSWAVALPQAQTGGGPIFQLSILLCTTSSKHKN